MANQERPNTVSRREFLVGAGALVVSGTSGEAFASNRRNELDAEQQEEYEALVKEIEGYIAAYAEADTHLSRREINTELDRCAFLEPPVPLLTLHTEKIQTDINDMLESDDPNSGRQALSYALDKNNFGLPRKQLVVIQADFEVLKPNVDAFYDTGYQALFVDQQPPKRKAASLHQTIYQGVMHSELNTRRNMVIDAMSGQSRELIEAELKKVGQQFSQDHTMRKRGNIHDVPPELLLRYQNNIRAAVSRTRMEAARRYVSNRSTLSHEAFHHFYETMFSRDDYQGPSQADALALALRGIRNRDALVQASTYAPEFFKRGLLEESAVDLHDDAGIDAFAKATSERFDFSHFPANEPDTPETRDRIAVYQLVNEFLARIYSGALGNTDDAYEYQIREAVKDIPFVQIDPAARTRDLQYHTPTTEELAFLRAMHWQDKPIVE